MYLCQQCGSPRVKGTSYCVKHQAMRQPRRRKSNKKYKSGKSKSVSPLAGDRRWAALSAQFLSEHPLCARCEQMGRVSSAVECDHVKPVRKYPNLVYNRDNLQPLCRKCHRIKTIRFEKRGQYPDYFRRVTYTI